MSVLIKRKGFIIFSGVLLFGGIALAISTSKESSKEDTKEGTKENSKEKAIYGTDDNHASFSYMLFLTGHIVSIDEETNTFRLHVIVEDDSERTLEVHFGEKPASGVSVSVSDYKVGDYVTIAYFPYDRKGSYINADSVDIFHEGYDRVRKDDRIPEYIY